MEYKTITFDNNKFNHYVVYENGQICRILKDGTHKPLKYTKSKKGGIKVTLCADAYRKSVSVNHITAIEFLGVELGEFDTVEPVDGDYTNTHKNNLKVVKKYKQVQPEFPKKKEGALRYCRVCDYRAETEEQLDDFVKSADPSVEYGRVNLCKSCRQAKRNKEANGGVLCSKIIYPEKVQQQMSYKRNRESRLAKAKEWAENNRGKSNSYKAKNKKERGLRTPKWLDEEEHEIMQWAYEFAQEQTEKYGVQFHVDHTIPLKGDKVSGLHVPENLQVIPWHENLAKGNKFEPHWL